MLSARSCSPPEMKILVPLMRYVPSSCSTARVFINLSSVPQCGSVRHLFAKLCGVREHVVDEFAAHIPKLRQVRLLFDLEEFVEQIAIVLERRTIDRHGVPPWMHHL